MSNNETDISIQGGSSGNANLIYILYLASIIVGITGLVGVIMAYVGKGEADQVTLSHYQNQIGIFWKSFLFFVVSFFLMFILIGFITFLVALVWYIMRNIKGMQALGRGEAIANPGSWGF